MNYIVPKYLLILLSRRVKRSSQSRKLDRKDNRFIETLHLLSGERKHTKKSPSHSWVTHFINLKPLQALYKFKCWEQECQKGKMALEDQLHRHKVQPKQEKMGWWTDLVLERLKKSEQRGGTVCPSKREEMMSTLIWHWEIEEECGTKKNDTEVPQIILLSMLLPTDDRQEII